ncbi:unnamed protein product [Anisakis simplex]|uniref:DUF2165 family protein n=1 Tax=Anisakis simplex TaxID=6269 RepID=A0A0M3JJC2_ANISI|nr:unnamed protein product [Anisakis simplex]
MVVLCALAWQTEVRILLSRFFHFVSVLYVWLSAFVGIGIS